jgi:hypothetical protein
MFVQELGKKAAVPSVYGLTFYVLGSVEICWERRERGMSSLMSNLQIATTWPLVMSLYVSFLKRRDLDGVIKPRSELNSR